MSLSIFVSARAERYLIAVHETIQTVACKLDLGRPRHFTALPLLEEAHLQTLR
ncbi:MAG: hypothetical protein JNJ83_03675 [Verrucomicrobiaceae bacterium]|nr:hypothetical protein [Verrucomicrobiaceae bacterium]